MSTGDRTISEEARERLLEAGWEWELRGGLLIWRRPGGRGSWYSQEMAIELLEFLEEEKRKNKKLEKEAGDAS